MLGHVLPLVMGLMGNAGQPATPPSNLLSSATSNVITVEGPSVNVGIPSMQMQPGNNPYPGSWPLAYTPSRFPQYPQYPPSNPYAMNNYNPYGQPYGYQNPSALSRLTRMIHDLLEWEKTLSPKEFSKLERGLNVSDNSLVKASSTATSKFNSFLWDYPFLIGI